MQCGDGLLGVPVDAGHAGAARAAEGVFTTLCGAHGRDGGDEGGEGLRQKAGERDGKKKKKSRVGGSFGRRGMLEVETVQERINK